LVDGVIKSNSKTPAAATIGKLLFADDGASYDNNDIFRYLGGYAGIQTCIKVRKNAKVN
jgi:hypothetical protein